MPRHLSNRRPANPKGYLYTVHTTCAFYRPNCFHRQNKKVGGRACAYDLSSTAHPSPVVLSLQRRRQWQARFPPLRLAPPRPPRRGSVPPVVVHHLHPRLLDVFSKMLLGGNEQRRRRKGSRACVRAACLEGRRWWRSGARLVALPPILRHFASWLKRRGMAHRGRGSSTPARWRFVSIIAR